MFGFNFKLIAIGILVVVAIGAIYSWKQSIKREATLEFNNAQLQKTIDDQNEYINKLKLVDEEQKEILNSLNIKNTELTGKLNFVTNYLTSEQANKDSRESSLVLKNTFKELAGEQK